MIEICHSSIAVVILQAAAQQEDTVMATEQASEPQPSSSAPGQPQNEKDAPAEETPASRRAVLLEEDMKRQAERLATPAPKPEDISALLPR